MDVNRLHADSAWCKNKILALQTLCKFGFGKVLLLSLEHLIWLQSRRPPPPPPPHCDHMPCLRNEQGVYTNGFHLHVSPPPSVPTPPSLSLSPLSVIVLHFVSAGTKGSELFDCEDGCHTDQCQQPQTWHHICLPHPALLHASPRLVPVLLPSVLCLLFCFFLLHFLLVFSVLLLIAASHRLRRLQRSPGAADTRRMWVLVSHLQPPKTGTGVRSGTWRVLLNHAAEMTNGCNPFFVPNPTVELWKGIKNYVAFQYHFLEPNIFITKIKDIRLKEPSTITFSFSRGRVLCKDNFCLNMQNFSWDVLYINKYKWMLMCKKCASIMWLEWKFIATGTHKAQLSRLYLSFICVWLNIISCVHWQRAASAVPSPARHVLFLSWIQRYISELLRFIHPAELTLRLQVFKFYTLKMNSWKGFGRCKLLVESCCSVTRSARCIFSLCVSLRPDQVSVIMERRRQQQRSLWWPLVKCTQARKHFNRTFLTFTSTSA